jgi:hypothetical protein
MMGWRVKIKVIKGMAWSTQTGVTLLALSASTLVVLVVKKTKYAPSIKVHPPKCTSS